MRQIKAIITCGGGSAPKAPDPLPPKPTVQDSRVVSSRDSELQRRRAAASNTVLTSYSGVSTPAGTQGKTLLGM